MQDAVRVADDSQQQSEQATIQLAAITQERDALLNQLEMMKIKFHPLHMVDWESAPALDPRDVTATWKENEHFEDKVLNLFIFPIPPT